MQVEQRDVPGIDNAFLAMDTEEGVEVVWNEVQFSEKKNFRSQQVRLSVFQFSNHLATAIYHLECIYTVNVRSEKNLNKK